jgi:hypothetical protein
VCFVVTIAPFYIWVNVCVGLVFGVGVQLCVLVLLAELVCCLGGFEWSFDVGCVNFLFTIVSKLLHA